METCPWERRLYLPGRAVRLADVQRVRSWPYLAGVTVEGFLYDIDTGRLARLG